MGAQTDDRACYVRLDWPCPLAHPEKHIEMRSGIWCDDVGGVVINLARCREQHPRFSRREDSGGAGPGEATHGVRRGSRSWSPLALWQMLQHGFDSGKSGALPWLAAQIRNVSPFADVPHWGPTAAQPCTPPPRGFRENEGVSPIDTVPRRWCRARRACAPLAFSVPVESLALAPCQHQKPRMGRSRGCISRRDGGAELILTVRVAVGLYGGSRSGTHDNAARPASSAARLHLRRVCTVIVSLRR